MDTLKVAPFQGVIPSKQTISTGKYRVSRPLFIYVKTQHIGVVPGLQEFVQFFVSDDMAGAGGSLDEAGLVADPALAKTQAAWQ
jgi:phosphate transport system substrate-binding protein